MGRLIRVAATTALPIIKKGVGILSDGSVVALVADNNQTGLAAPAVGDGTNVLKLYVYHSTDRLNWTLKATISTLATNSPGRYLAASMVVDASNNIHVIYTLGPTGAVIYSKLTYSAGPAWSVGGGTTVVASLSGYDRTSIVDIDTLNNTEALVAVVYWYNTTTGARKSAIQPLVKPAASGTWTAHPVHVLLANESHLGHTDDVSVSGDNKDTSSSTTSLFAFYATAKGASGADYGDVVIVTKVNPMTGAAIGSRQAAATGMFKGVGGGFRKGWLFNSGVNRFALAAVVDNDLKIGLYHFEWNRTPHVMGTQSPVGVSGGRGGLGINRGISNHNWAAVAYNGDEKFFFFANVYGQAVVATGYISTGTNWGVFNEAGWARWDNGYGQPSGTWESDGVFRSPTVAPLEQIWSGATRNLARSRIDATLYHHRSDSSGGPQSYRLESRSLLALLTPGAVTPAVGATVSTDRPTVTGGHRLQQYWPQLPVKMQWQIASDAGFTTNLRTIDEPSSDFFLASGTSAPYNAVVSSSEAVPAVSELTQGTWYIRARSLDTAYVFGPWSSPQAFVVTHPPVGANLYPTGGAVFLYGGGGNVTFTWTFTDPSPWDLQTAYQIVVENASDGSTVLDSGKVTSSVQTATLAIPAPGKDIDLRWKLTVWDSDDVAGPASGYNVFYTTDPPAPTIVAPANLSVITTGIPTVTWTPGIGGTKVQAKYRVMVTQGVNVAYTSNWIDSPGTSHTLPVGHLFNGQEYTIRLDVQDNLGLQGMTQTLISTDWIEPVGPDTSWEVYVSEYETRGFVYVTWTDANMDADFASWNVYRRLVGESNWTQIGTYSSGAGRYAHRDYYVGSARTYEYTITQMVDRFGDYVESLPDKIVRVTPDADNYWLIDPLVPSNSIPLYQVTADPFTEEYEQATYNIIGAGRHVEYGDRIGYIGTLTSQLRDKFASGRRMENYALNPAMSLKSVNGAMPDGWTFAVSGTSGNVSFGDYETQNPSPSGKVPFRLYSDGVGTTSSDSIRFEQVIQGSDMPASMKISGRATVLSAWVAVSALNANKRYRLSVEWLDGAGATISTASSAALDVSLDSVSSYVPWNGPDAQAGNATQIWRRLQFQATVPGTAPSGVRLKIQLEGNGGSSTAGELIASGIQFETEQLTNYFDGDQFGGEWSGIPGLSYSFGTGYYTARQQRKALERIKSEKTWIYLRNPFGDLWRVAPSDIAAQRIAGVGKAEFVDVTIPYQEVGQ